GIGVAVATMVLSWAHGVIAGTSADHSGLVSAGHHGMSAFEHAVRDGGAVAPLVVLVAALAAAVPTVVARFRRATAAGAVRGVAGWTAVTSLVAGVFAVVPAAVLPAGSAGAAEAPAPACDATTAVRSYDVAAINVFVPYTRWDNDFGAPVIGPDGMAHSTDGNPNGMIYVLQRDKLAVKNWAVPINGTPGSGYANDIAQGRRIRPRPLVLRANVGECVEVKLTNELTPRVGADFFMTGFLPRIDPRVSMHAFGVSVNPQMTIVNGQKVGGDGSATGYNTDSTVGIGESITYYWRAPKSDGLYLFRDMGMPAGGPTDGGGAEEGLYGGLAVQPAGSRWFDPISGSELSSTTARDQYAAVANQSGDLYIDSVIVQPDGKRYRESIQISQDIIPIVAPPAPPPPAIAPIIAERFAFNYGAESDAKREAFKEQWCADCVGEETSLSSWVYGDPGTVKLGGGSGPWYPEVQLTDPLDAAQTPKGAVQGNVEDCGLYLTNQRNETRPLSCYTANVVRAYQGDPIKIRFGHAGVVETHVFHLHAHTWAAEPDDQGPAGAVPPRPTASVQPRATTIDSQTYGPWTAFTANLNYGAGARAGTVGDSIFHCHLYPHFAGGFWALLRSHDVREDGSGATPDGKRVNAWVPLAEIGVTAVAPHPEVPAAKSLPSFDNPGYPRFIPGKFGWRAPQPPNSIFQRAFDPATGDPALDPLTGLIVEAPAMRIVAGTGLDAGVLGNGYTVDATDLPAGQQFRLMFNNESTLALTTNSTASQVKQALEGLVSIEGANVTQLSPAVWHVQIVFWRPTANMTMMATSAGNLVLVEHADLLGGAWDPTDRVLVTEMYQLALEQHVGRKSHDPTYQAGGAVNPDRAPLPGAPMVDPCPDGAREVTYRASVIQVPLIYNDAVDAQWVDVQGRMMVADQDVNAVMSGDKKPEPFFFRVNAGDCINFELTNRTPNYIGSDAYQTLVQTNMVGTHIHLVNFDVLASDGSSNGWNYQQAAFTEDQALFNADVLAGLAPCDLVDGCTVALPDVDVVEEMHAVRGGDLAVWRKNGQTIKERWFADYELRTIFMHDHHFAAVMQNRGMFNALIVEPAGFDFRDTVTGQFRQPINDPRNGIGCNDPCQGQAYGANMDIIGPGNNDDFREFGIAVHDYIPIIMTGAVGGIDNLTLADIQDPANAVAPPVLGPTAFPIGDQGIMGINYRTEPMVLRQPDPANGNPRGTTVDPAYTFSSRIWGDPATPVLHAYRGDNVRFRLIQGSHEEQHNFTVHGIRWKKDAADKASPYINARAMGVSEAFNIDDRAIGCGLATTTACNDSFSSPRVVDLLYGGTGVEDLWFGAWGILRVFDQQRGSAINNSLVDPAPLAALPRLIDNTITYPVGTALPAANPDIQVPKIVGADTASCPDPTRIKRFNVSAIDVPIAYNRYGDHDPYGLAYVMTKDVAAIRANPSLLAPLVLRVTEGDCIVVNLKNEVNWDAWAVHGDEATLDGDAPIPLEPVPALPVAPGEPVPAPIAGNPWIGGNRVSLHPALVRYDVRTSDGATIGYNHDQTAGPGETASYVWYADEVIYDDPQNPTGLTDGELGAIPLMEFGDVRGHRHHGLLAALVVGPANATYHDPYTGDEIDYAVPGTVVDATVVDVRVPGGAEDYRDAVIFHQNGLNLRKQGPPPVPGAEPPLVGFTDPRIILDPMIGDWPDLGERAISYKNAPLHHRLDLGSPITNIFTANPVGIPFTTNGFGLDLANAFSSTHIVREVNGQPFGDPIGDPDTPIIRAYQGDPVRVHVVQTADRGRMLETEISGHSWLEHAFDTGSVRAGVQGGMATNSAFTFHLGAAGGDGQHVGDYRYGVVHGFMGMSSGSWGILRVYPKPDAGTEKVLSALHASQNPYEGGNPIMVLERDTYPDPPLPEITLSTPYDFVVVPDPNLGPVPITATVTVSGKPLRSQGVVVVVRGSEYPGTTDRNGQVTVHVPLGLPAGAVQVTGWHDSASQPAVSTVMVMNVVDRRVDLQGPMVATVSPANNATATDTADNVVLTFNEQLHPDSITSSTVRLLRGGNPVEATRTLGPVVAGKQTVTINPKDDLVNNTQYTVEVTTGVTDRAGNALGVVKSNINTVTTPAAPFSSTFRTWNVPSATGKPVATWGDNWVTLEWSAPSSDGGTPVTDYKVQYSTDKGANWTTYDDGVSTNRTVTVSGLAEGVEHIFQVAPVNRAGRGDYSAASDPVIPRGIGTQGLVSLTPVRVFDTRPGQPDGAVVVAKKVIGGATVLKVKVAGVGGVPLSGVAAVSLNVTVTEPVGNGFLTVYPCGRVPQASNLNFVRNQTIPNSVIAPLSANGEVCFYSNVNTHVLADVSGWFKNGISLNPVDPVRVFDTRQTEPQGAVG
ncbi:MAG: hypothetical protein RI958_2330, partial [Actinomycetota bacterium]